MHDQIKTSELMKCELPYLSKIFYSYEYPWQLLPDISSVAAALTKTPPPSFTRIADGIVIGKNVSIHESAVLLPPIVLGDGCTVRPGAFLRGNIIAGRSCVIGNSTELKNCILLDGVQLPHYNYVGDSIIGNRAHMGAGAVCSNLKSDGKPVVIHGDTDYATGLRKLGAILGDNADIGCGCVLNPGTVVGRNTSIYPLTPIRGVIPPDCIVKSPDCIVIRE